MADYVPTDWVDFATPVNAANLDKMEAGIDTAHQEIDALDGRLDTVEGKPALPTVVDGQWVKGVGGVPVWASIAQADVTGLVAALGAKEALVNKGAVNGYAPLGADQKVPLTNLPDDIGGGGGAELVFEGDYVPATEYQDGDYVMKDGVVYVCVGGPTTAPPDSTLWPMAGTAPDAAVGYGTSLPASPLNGQEYILVDSLTAPTFSWRFRFNANATGTYKWDFIGGAPIVREVATAETTTSTTYVALATPGPSIALPRAGVYQIAHGLLGDNASNDGQQRMSYDIGATAAVDADSCLSVVGFGGHPADGNRVREKTIATATTLTAKYRTDRSTGTFSSRYLSAVPVRVA
jgi:hypothetical protein